MAQNNRGAIRTNYDNISFPSRFESVVYLTLKTNYKGKILCASAGDKTDIVVKPKTDTFPSVIWHPDFILPDENLIIEAKGKFEPEWILKMKFLEYTSPLTFSRVIVVLVDASRSPWKNAKVLNLYGVTKLMQSL